MKAILIVITVIMNIQSAYAQSDSTRNKMSPPEINHPNDVIIQSPNHDRDSANIKTGKTRTVKPEHCIKIPAGVTTL